MLEAVDRGVLALASRALEPLVGERVLDRIGCCADAALVLRLPQAVDRPPLAVSHSHRALGDVVALLGLVHANVGEGLRVGLEREDARRPVAAQPAGFREPEPRPVRAELLKEQDQVGVRLPRPGDPFQVALALLGARARMVEEQEREVTAEPELGEPVDELACLLRCAVAARPEPRERVGDDEVDLVLLDDGPEASAGSPGRTRGPAPTRPGCSRCAARRRAPKSRGVPLASAGTLRADLRSRSRGCSVHAGT